MKHRYILLESCHISIRGITDYYILDTETDMVVEYSGFASFEMAAAWYEDYCENHKDENNNT